MLSRRHAQTYCGAALASSLCGASPRSSPRVFSPASRILSRARLLFLCSLARVIAFVIIVTLPRLSHFLFGAAALERQATRILRQSDTALPAARAACSMRVNSTGMRAHAACRRGARGWSTGFAIHDSRSTRQRHTWEVALRARSVSLPSHRQRGGGARQVAKRILKSNQRADEFKAEGERHRRRAGALIVMT